jgi:hypothetical protein
MIEWISYKDHPVPDDIRGLLFKYPDGSIFPDWYKEDSTRRFYNGILPTHWIFMERRNPNERTVQASS